MAMRGLEVLTVSDSDDDELEVVSENVMRSVQLTPVEERRLLEHLDLSVPKNVSVQIRVVGQGGDWDRQGLLGDGLAHCKVTSGGVVVREKSVKTKNIFSSCKDKVVNTANNFKLSEIVTISDDEDEHDTPEQSPVRKLALQKSVSKAVPLTNHLLGQKKFAQHKRTKRNRIDVQAGRMEADLVFREAKTVPVGTKDQEDSLVNSIIHISDQQDQEGKRNTADDEIASRKVQEKTNEKHIGVQAATVKADLVIHKAQTVTVGTSDYEDSLGNSVVPVPSHDQQEDRSNTADDADEEATNSNLQEKTGTWSPQEQEFALEETLPSATATVADMNILPYLSLSDSDDQDSPLSQRSLKYDVQSLQETVSLKCNPNQQEPVPVICQEHFGHKLSNSAPSDSLGLISPVPSPEIVLESDSSASYSFSHNEHPPVSDIFSALGQDFHMEPSFCTDRSISDDHSDKDIISHVEATESLNQTKIHVTNKDDPNDNCSVKVCSTFPEVFTTGSIEQSFNSPKLVVQPQDDLYSNSVPDSIQAVVASPVQEHESTLSGSPVRDESAGEENNPTLPILPLSFTSLTISPGQLFLPTGQLSQLVPSVTAVDVLSLCSTEDTVWGGWSLSHISLGAVLKVLDKFGDSLGVREEIELKLRELNKINEETVMKEDNPCLALCDCKEEEFLAIVGLCRKDKVQDIRNDLKIKKDLARSKRSMRSGTRRKQTSGMDVVHSKRARESSAARSRKQERKQKKEKPRK
eukprot:GFUD01017832.1.p1 GENE.GFUD01017832.1~~GFUD01017832.1.p1  ORF type:complete len:749 (-),score=217.74 GFUD01017832.1:247-2493(-)